MNEGKNELILAQDKAQDKAQDEIVNEKISNMNEEEKKITGEIDISKTIESNIDYWRNKCFEQQKEIEARLEEIDSLYKMMSVKDDEIKYLEIKLEQYGEEYQILKDDIEEHNVVYVDTPEFEENYVSKDKIRKKIDLIDKEYAETIEKNKNDLYLVNINAQRHNAMQSILEELLGD